MATISEKKPIDLTNLLRSFFEKSVQITHGFTASEIVCTLRNSNPNLEFSYLELAEPLEKLILDQEVAFTLHQYPTLFGWSYEVLFFKKKQKIT